MRMEKNIQERISSIKFAIMENESEEEQKKEQIRIRNASKRSCKRVQQSFSFFPMPVKTMYPKEKYKVQNSNIDLTTIENEKEDSVEKIFAYQYVTNFLLQRVIKKEYGFSLSRLIHAADIALIVSDDQVDVDIIQTSSNRWNSSKMENAINQLLQEGILKTTMTKGKYACTYSSDQANTLYKNCTQLEKILASNLEKVYTRLESGAKPDLSELMDTVYNDLTIE